MRGRLGLPTARDLHFCAEKHLSAYARDARRAGRIIVQFRKRTILRTVRFAVCRMAAVPSETAVRVTCPHRFRAGEVFSRGRCPPDHPGPSPTRNRPARPHQPLLRIGFLDTCGDQSVPGRKAVTPRSRASHRNSLREFRPLRASIADAYGPAPLIRACALRLHAIGTSTRPLPVQPSSLASSPCPRLQPAGSAAKARRAVSSTIR